MKTKLLFLLTFLFYYNFSYSNICDGSIVCKASIVVNLDIFCEATVTPEMVLYEVCPGISYKVQLFDDPPDLINDLSNPIDGSYIGSTIVAKVTDVGSNNACTADVVLRDVTPPSIDLVGAPASLSCMDNLQDVISIGTIDNCTGSEAKFLSSRYVCHPCENDSVYITYEVVDFNGNRAEETKGFEFFDFCMDVEFPPDVSYSCPPEMGEIPSITVNDTDFCARSVTINYDDIRLGCDISRIYTISEDCSDKLIRHTQIIDVEDFDPPSVFVLPVDAPITLEAYNDGFKPLYEAAAFCGILYTTIDETIKDVISCDPVRFLVEYEIQTVDVCFNASPIESVLVEVFAEDPSKVKISGQKDCRDDFIITAKPRDMVEPITYSWSSSNAGWTVTKIPGTNTASVSPGTGKATMEVTAIDALGCVQTDSKKYYCKRRPFGFSANSGDTNIYPNPATESINIHLPEDIKTVELYTLDGKKIHSFLNIEGRDLMIDLSNYSPGLYFLRIHSDDKVWTEKIIKE